MANAVICTVKNSLDATTIVDQLKAAGFTASDISVLMPDKQGSKDFAIENETKSPEGATIGAGTGAVLGGSLGWLVGIGALAIPGVGPLIAAGPIMAALTGVALGGTVGGITGALIGLGIPEYEASSQRIEAVCNSGSRLPRYRIVVVDDDRSMTFLMSRLLQSLGQSVSVASSGELAIETVVRLEPQVVFLDLQMQGMSGYEVARHLRERAEFKNLVLIALSGRADDASRQHAIDCGFDRYLVKPTSIAQLSETLRDIAPLIDNPYRCIARSL